MVGGWNGYPNKVAGLIRALVRWHIEESLRAGTTENRTLRNFGTVKLKLKPIHVTPALPLSDRQ